VEQLTERETSNRGVEVKRPHYLLKVFAVVSSVLLAGGFVSYRAGAFNERNRTSAESADPGNTPPDSESKTPVRFFSTKSAYVSSPVSWQDLGYFSTQPTASILSGTEGSTPAVASSPGFAPLFPQLHSTADLPSSAPEAAESPQTFMAGPKSDVMFRVKLISWPEIYPPWTFAFSRPQAPARSQKP
jgi:hypothetical protein